MTIPIVVAVTVVDASFISVEVVLVAASPVFDKFAACVKFVNLYKVLTVSTLLCQ